MIRHFTASGLILRDGHVLLVRHLKSGLWLYPGGHLTDNEDPAQAALREISEEGGLRVEIVSEQRFSHPAVGILPLPFTIMVEDIGDHQHIDMIYLCRPPLPGHVNEQSPEIGGHQRAGPRRRGGQARHSSGAARTVRRRLEVSQPVRLLAERPGRPASPARRARTYQA